MIKIGKYKYHLSRWQFDFEDKLSLIQLMNFLLVSAGRHAEERNFGIDKLMSQGHSWVLLRVRIEFFADLLEKSQIEVETWVDEFKELYTNRRFNVLDSSGNVLCAASTTWAMIDIQNRKMVHLNDLINEDFLYLEKESLTAVPSKIPAIYNYNEVQRQVVALYSSIDINNHVTTTRYIQWILDSFSIDIFKQNKIKLFEINFQNEAKFSDSLDVHKQQISENSYIIELIKSPNIHICKSRISFENKY